MRKLLFCLLFLTTVSAFAALIAGDPAPDFTLPDIRTDENVSLSDFRGQVVVLQIWKTN
ncbi:MAG: redoxin domain-containing protein [FCB group bacterium]|nr:redoxin domain-containing protein [FCB group bacterium]